MELSLCVDEDGKNLLFPGCAAGSTCCSWIHPELQTSLKATVASVNN
jgi:hypothetical protein